MKSKLLAGILWLTLMTVAPAQTTNLTTLLQQGLMEEQANQNLDAAIADYQQLATQFDKDRQVAATAIFRIGECYRMLGRTNEAAAQYQRILHEFSDQKSLATLSEQNLKGMGMMSPGERPVGLLSPEEQVGIIERKLAILREQQEGLGTPSPSTLSPEMQVQVIEHRRQLAQLEDQLKTLEGASLEQQRIIMQQNYSNPVLSSLLDHFGNLQKRLAEVNDWPSRNHTQEVTNEMLQETARITTVMDGVNLQINDQIKMVVNDLQQKIATEKAILDVLGQQSLSTSPAAAPATKTSDHEDQEIQRIQQVIQNSPDLVDRPLPDRPGSDGNTELSQAVKAGEFKVVAYLLDHGANINQSNRRRSPLEAAVEAGNRAMVEYLLDHGADLNASANRGALYLAVDRGFPAVTEVLLAHKVDVNAFYAGGFSPLYTAAGTGQKKLVQMLLAAGADPNQVNHGGVTALNNAIGVNSPEVVSVLLAAGAEVNLENEDKRTPLSFAVEFNNPEVIKLLLDAKADPNGSKVNPPLLLAIKLGNTNIMELLLLAGANPNAVGSLDRLGTVQTDFELQYESHCSHMTPLWLAINTGSLPAVRLLLRFKADPNDTQTTGQSLLFDMLFWPAMLEAMLDAGARTEVTTSDEAELTPLAMAATKNYAQAVEILLKHGANPNFHNRNGVTPLHRAVYDLADEKVFELLLAGGANPNVRTGNGRTPLDELNHRRDDQNSTPEQRAKAIILADLLRRHGALDKLPDWDRIVVSRTSANFSEPVFFKAASDWNHFTLLEALGQFYARQTEPSLGQTSFIPSAVRLPFPDLSHITIVRSSHDSTNDTRTTVNLLNETNGIDLSKDVPLKFGDVIEIPERDHPLGEMDAGLTRAQSDAIAAHFSGKIELIAGGKKTEIQLYSPPWSSSLNSTLGRREAQDTLLSSSDLSRVKVTRHDSPTGKEQSWIIDCTPSPTSTTLNNNPPRDFKARLQAIVNASNGHSAPDISASPNDLLLRDGDVIEVPEK